MIYKTETTYPLETVKAQLEEKAKQLGFGILGSYEFKKLLKERGF